MGIYLHAELLYMVWNIFSKRLATLHGTFRSREKTEIRNRKFTSIISQLSPEIFDPRKLHPNFLEANFEYFILSTARDDENK